MRLRTLLRTSVLQLTLVYVALFGASVLALFGFIYWSTLGYLERQTNETIPAPMIVGLLAAILALLVTRPWRLVGEGR